MKESDLKVWVRNNWDGWSESFEPRMGTGVGIPDMMLIVRERLVPVELKVGTLSDDGLVLFPNEVRPPQLAWHRACNSAGVPSYFLVGVGDGKKPDRLFRITLGLAVFWKDGLDVDALVEMRTAKNKFSIDVRRWM